MSRPARPKFVVESALSLLDRFLVTLFTPECAGCRSRVEHGNACATCLELTPIIAPYCERCGEPTSETIKRCGSCPTRFVRELSSIRSLWWLTDESRTLWYRVKYGHRRDLTRSFRKLLERDFTTPILGKNAIIPVPVHIRKYLDRGFNQAEEIATWIARLTEAPLIVNGLIKVKPTMAQTGLSRAMRLRNLAGSLKWNVKINAPERVLLIDDVVTTGSTLNRCARVLVKHGVKEVVAWTMFRTPKWLPGSERG